MSTRLDQNDITEIMGVPIENGEGHPRSGKLPARPPLRADARNNLRSTRGYGDFPLAQRTSRIEQPLEGIRQLLDRRPAARSAVPLGVLHGACQHIQLVVQPIELVSGDDELILAEFQLCRSLPRDPVPLTTAL